MDVVDVVAEADKVVGHFKCSGTHEGEWRGHPATGRRFQDVDEIYVFRVELTSPALDRCRGQPRAHVPARAFDLVGRRPSVNGRRRSLVVGRRQDGVVREGKQR